MKIHYQEADLSTVFQYYVADFKPRDGGKIESYEAFVDVARGRVVFKLYVSGVEPEETNR